MTELNCLQPLEDNLVVEVLDVPQDGLIWLFQPTIFEVRPRLGKVIACGEGYRHNGKRIPMTVQKGDTIIINTYSSNKIAFLDDSHVIISERDAYCLIEE